MKSRPFLPIARLAILSLAVSVTAASGVAAQTNNLVLPKAPTGLYVSVAEISPTFTMRIATNGNYQVDIGACGPLGCQSQVGTWQWDSQRQEFLLSSTRELWKFDFRRFVVDQHEPDTLEWVLLEGTGNVLGVYKRIKFKRQPEEP